MCCSCYGTGNVPYIATIKGIADIFVGLTSVEVVTEPEALNEILREYKVPLAAGAPSLIEEAESAPLYLR